MATRSGLIKKKQMKKKLILTCVLILAVLPVCITSFGKEKELPPVLFSYFYTNAYYGSVWTIDNQGNIYRFHDDWSLDMGDYENRKQGENCAYVKTIDEDIVREKYMLFQKILSDNHYKKDLNAIKSGMIVIDNNGMGPQKWYGYSCNWKGEQEYTLMHGIDGREYLSEDIRMKKLADWAMGLIETDIWDYNKYCKELKTEEYYQEYLRQKQNGELP